MDKLILLGCGYVIICGIITYLIAAGLRYLGATITPGEFFMLGIVVIAAPMAFMMKEE